MKLNVEFKPGFIHIIGFVLFAIFLVLRLTNVIDWSWFWIIFPLWLPWAITILIFIIVLTIYKFKGDL